MSVRPINTVAELKLYLDSCNPEAKVLLMPEDGDGYSIGGCLEFTSAPGSPEVWLLIDEFGEEGNTVADDWSGGGIEGDPQQISIIETPTIPRTDVVVIRGLLRSA